MGIFSSLFGGPPKAPPVPLPPPAAHPVTLGSETAVMAGQNAKAAGAAAEGMGSNDTVKTSPQGVLQEPKTAKATLLG